MACFHPQTVWKNRAGELTFKPGQGVGFSFKIPCRNCIGCRMDHSRKWAIRLVHEAQMHRDNAFLTLTYNDENLPLDGSLDVIHFQLFMKRLRKSLCPIQIRFFHCGEYGSQYGRPHYHALIFGYGFPDKVHWDTKRGVKLYRSPLLDSLWAKGFASVGDVTFESAAYVARYIIKKQTGSRAEKYYEYSHRDTGEVTQRRPEYITMSRRPGIGASWLNRYETDVYPGDVIIHKGKKFAPPSYYDDLYERAHGTDSLVEIRTARKKRAVKYDFEQTPERLAVREFIQADKISRLKRETIS